MRFSCVTDDGTKSFGLSLMKFACLSPFSSNLNHGKAPKDGFQECLIQTECHYQSRKLLRVGKYTQSMHLASIGVELPMMPGQSSFPPPDFDQFRRSAANVIYRLLFTEQIGGILLEIVLKSVSMSFALSDVLIE